MYRGHNGYQHQQTPLKKRPRPDIDITESDESPINLSSTREMLDALSDSGYHREEIAIKKNKRGQTTLHFGKEHQITVPKQNEMISWYPRGQFIKAVKTVIGPVDNLDERQKDHHGLSYDKENLTNAPRKPSPIENRTMPLNQQTFYSSYDPRNLSKAPKKLTREQRDYQQQQNNKPKAVRSILADINNCQKISDSASRTMKFK